MKKFNMVTTSLSLVVATIFVSGALVFPYNYAMAYSINENGCCFTHPHPHPQHPPHSIGNHDASKSNTHNGLVTHPHPNPPHSTINTTRDNIRGGCPVCR
jgi:hypothetical protein